MFNIQSTAAAAAAASIGSDSGNYDFTREENAIKWQGLFVASLRRVLEQLHPSLNAGDDALLYVESLCLHLLGLLCAKPSPHSINDIAERVGKTFPNPIENWALKEAHDTVDKSKKSKKSVLPVEKIHSLLCKEVLQYKIDLSVGTFMVAVLEYISADILKLAGNYVKNIRHVEILREDIKIAMCADKVLMDMFSQDATGNTPMQISPLPPTPRDALTYEDVVKELIHEEKQYQRELHMIIRVFREELAKVVKDPAELDPIFANITDVYELTVTLLGSLEDVIEMAQEETAPCVGNCFEELAEGEEFEVYSRYARDITSSESRDALQNLLNRHDSSKLTTAGHGFREAVKFYLPKLLLGPIWHAFLYLDYVKMLLELSANREDRESFSQVQGLLKPMQCELQRAIATMPKDVVGVHVQTRTRRQLAIEKVKELQQTVDLWDKDMAGTNCNEFIRTDTLQIITKRNVTERKVYLFDGLMVMCKANTRRQAITTIVPNAFEYRLKEKFHMRRVEIIDRPDPNTGDGGSVSGSGSGSSSSSPAAHAFEIAPRGNSAATVMVAKTSQQKNEWMADLVMVTTKSMLDRILDSILLDIEKKHPLRMPSPEQYRFAVPDAPDNIVLEERESTGVPLIKGATLCKLIERLTYHIYADPMFVRTFLTTYRSFCSPHELLTLLLERFAIPDPSLVYNTNSGSGGVGGAGLGGFDAANELQRDLESDKVQKNLQREDHKRYKKEYVQPVQFRVLNVLRHWVDHHYYDFENDRTLLAQLLGFLDKVNGKSMRKWVDSVLKIVQRKREQEANHKQITFAFGSSPPPIESHLKVHDSEITLLTLHPIELARQLTLLEFELYKKVKPSELVGKVWTTSTKNESSPNLLRIIHHTTNFTRWIEKSILDAENFDERVAMFSRAIEVMTVLLELNNFNSVISIASAMAGAAVFRLHATKAAISARQRNILDECLNLTIDHSRRYQEKLRSINPPCVPFFGMYLTNILHLEEGNLDLLANTELINFSKRRKVAETIGEIQQYQNQPYCLKEDATIKNFLENLDPYNGLPDEKVPDLVWAESNRIEPKDVRPPPKFPRRWPDINLKSPGIKPRRQHQNSSSGSSIISPGSLPFSSKSNSSHTLHSNSHGQTHGSGNHFGSTGGGISASVSTSTIAHGDGELSPGNTNFTQSASCSFSPNAIDGANINNSCSSQDNEMSDSLASNASAHDTLSVAPQLPKRSNSITSLVNQTVGTDTKPILSPRAFDPHHPHHQQFQQHYHHHHHQHHHNQQHVHPVHQQQHHHQQTSPGTTSTTTSCRYQPVVSPKCLDVLHEERTAAAAATAAKPSAIGNDCVSPSTADAPAAAYRAAGPIPLSPHVNVPPNSTMASAAQLPPPPLPPRVPRRDIDMAQQRQAADAPRLPPRDASPPPLPPRRAAWTPDAACACPPNIRITYGTANAASAQSTSPQHHQHHQQHQYPAPHHLQNQHRTLPHHGVGHQHQPHHHHHHHHHAHHPQPFAQSVVGSTGVGSNASTISSSTTTTCDMSAPSTVAPSPPSMSSITTTTPATGTSASTAGSVATNNGIDSASFATSLQLINTSQIMRRRSSAMERCGSGTSPELTTSAVASRESDASTADGDVASNPFQTTKTATSSVAPPPAPRRMSSIVSPRFSPGETTPRLPPKPKSFIVQTNGQTMFPYPGANVTNVPTENTSYTLPL